MLIKFEQLKPFFEKTPVSGVLHLGAHLAEELEGYQSCGIDRVIWVEANTNLAIPLINRTVNDLGSTIVLGAAFNEDDKLLELNVANNGESSSLLNFDEHSKEHPHVEYIGKVQTWAFKIDTMMDKKGFDRALFNFANIDIQGAELIALKGMNEQLKYLDYVYLEVNEKHLYEDCALIPELDEFLSAYGFKREITEMTIHGWGDALYVRKHVTK
jgi:FkbM family methyltransferase|tara:strand:+ start:687 stop:1328 length:642 start_codon:yes stop_codon:yes gene_type:complete